MQHNSYFHILFNIQNEEDGQEGREDEARNIWCVIELNQLF